MATGPLTSLGPWRNIESRLDSGLKGWRSRVEDFGRVAAVKERATGQAWTDDETFEGLLMAVLSNNAVWSRSERIRADLAELFSDFSLESYAEPAGR